ncbi:MAG: hypothetical protein IT261_10410 [Saprospiraceae bacterium]|nr:hypothetical protein [Saprospiraceae bacterium]
MTFKDFHGDFSTKYRKYILYLFFAVWSGSQCLAFSGKYPIRNFMPSDYKSGI